MPDHDFIARNEGTIILLTPVSEQAQEWAEEYLEEGQTWPTEEGQARVIGHRYFDDIVEGIWEEEMTIGSSDGGTLIRA